MSVRVSAARTGWASEWLPVGGCAQVGVYAHVGPAAVAHPGGDEVAGPLHAQVDHGLGLARGRVEGIRPLHLPQHAVQLLVPLPARHGAEVVTRPEADDDTHAESHTALLTPGPGEDTRAAANLPDS